MSGEVGPARISIEAVAARAGLSKGGLLYHFPSKQTLLRALVAEHVATIRAGMDAIAPEGAPAVQRARAYLRTASAKLAEPTARPGIFAAIAENPEFIAPMRAFREEMLDVVFGRCPDPVRARIVFLATEGLIHAKLIDPQAYDRMNVAEIFAKLEAMLEA